VVAEGKQRLHLKVNEPSLVVTTHESTRSKLPQHVEHNQTEVLEEFECLSCRLVV